MQSLTTTPDSRILAFNFAIAIAAGLLFGLTPRSERPADLAVTLKDQAGNVGGGFAQVRFRK